MQKSDLPDPGLLMTMGLDVNNIKPCLPKKKEAGGEKWLSIYGSRITERLNNAFGIPALNDNGQDDPYLRFNEIDILRLMSVCGFETALRNGAKSPWCDVFTEEEWEANEYFYDLTGYYRYGPGSSASRSQGSGWVKKLVERLAGTPTQYAGTGDTTSDETFSIPPSSPMIFADFSSDSNIVPVISALGILQGENALSPIGPPSKDRIWVASKIRSLWRSSRAASIFIPLRAVSKMNTTWVITNM